MSRDLNIQRWPTPEKFIGGLAKFSGGGGVGGPVSPPPFGPPGPVTGPSPPPIVGALVAAKSTLIAGEVDTLTVTVTQGGVPIAAWPVTLHQDGALQSVSITVGSGFTDVNGQFTFTLYGEEFHNVDQHFPRTWHFQVWEFGFFPLSNIVAITASDPGGYAADFAYSPGGTGIYSGDYYAGYLDTGNPSFILGTPSPGGSPALRIGPGANPGPYFLKTADVYGHACPKGLWTYDGGGIGPATMTVL